MKDFFQRYYARLAAWAGRLRASNTRLEAALPEVEKFVIAGPTLLGFVLGITRYAPGNVYFETAFQSLVFFVFYLVALTIVQAADSLLLGSWPIILGILRSLLAALYLFMTLRQYLQWRKGSPVMLAAVSRLRNRVRLLIGDAN